MKTFIIISLGLLSFAACTPKESINHKESIVEVNPEGGNLNLKVGATLPLSIEGNPTTGYNWEYKSATGAVEVKDMGAQPKTAPKEGEHPMMGAPSMMNYGFRGVKAGKDTVTFVYRRSFEPESIAPIKKIKWVVVVE